MYYVPGIGLGSEAAAINRDSYPPGADSTVWGDSNRSQRSTALEGDRAVRERTLHTDAEGAEHIRCCGHLIFRKDAAGRRAEDSWCAQREEAGLGAVVESLQG